METAIQNDIVSKIQKLLRLAENNTSDSEREKALIHARRLCDEHELELAELDSNKWSSATLREEIKREDIQLGGRKSICQKFVSDILANHFNVRIVNSGSRYSGQRIVLMGKKSDVEIAKYVQSYLNSELMRLWHEYKSLNNSRTEERNSFLWGCWRGLNDKLKQSKEKFDKEVEQQKGAEVSHSLALMRISDKERVDTFVDKQFPSLRKGRSSYVRGVHSQNAQNAGYAKGQAISLRRGIGSGTTQNYIE